MMDVNAPNYLHPGVSKFTPPMKSLSVAELADMLRAAQDTHHDAEKVLPPHDWAEWYAHYILERVTLYQEAR